MKDQSENFKVSKVTFFGNGAPASGELIVDAVCAGKASSDKLTNAADVTSFSIANLPDNPPGVTHRAQVYEAARLLIKAYMLQDTVSLEYKKTTKNDRPWLTKITYGKDQLDLLPGPI